MKTKFENNQLMIVTEEDFLSDNIAQLHSLIKEVIATANVGGVTLDLGQTGAVDSYGLNLISGLYAECKKKNWTFNITNVQQPVQHLLNVLKLTEKFHLKP